MQWYISKNIDNSQEIIAREHFLSELTNKNFSKIDNEYFYILKDSIKDNRRFIVGHTDDVEKAIRSIVKIRNHKKYIFYICACIMNYSYAQYFINLAPHCDIYFSKQEHAVIENKNVFVCHFLDKNETGFDFKITKTELDLYNIKGKFKDLLNQCFIKIKG